MDTLTPAISVANSQLISINTSLQKIASMSQGQPFWSTQLFAAIVGALFGLIPFIYLIWKDRPIIKVKVSQSLVPINHLGGKVRNGLTIKVSNTGRRQVTISDVFLKFKNGETMIFPNDALFVDGRRLPKTLTESTSHTVIILTGDLAQGILKKQEYPVEACYRSVTDKVYKCKISKKFWDNIFKINESLSLG